jgi:hypothetical protein
VYERAKLRRGIDTKDLLVISINEGGGGLGVIGIKPAHEMSG